MNELDRFWIHDSATMQEAIAMIQKNNSRCVVVVGVNQKVVGTFSEGDVLRAILAGVDVHTPLRNLVKPSFHYLTTRDLKAAKQLLLNGITLVPVIDHEFRLRSCIVLEDVFGTSSGEST
jgi:CBS domain-containing protein